MSAIPLEHITVILRMACAMEQVPLTRKGMDALDNEIDDRYKPESENISVKYLDEHILKPIVRAHETGNTTVNLGIGKVNKLCDFIRFTDYQGFCNAWSLIKQFVNPDHLKGSNPSFKCIYKNSDEENVNKQCNGAQYPEQNLNLASPLLLGESDVNALKRALNTETGIVVVNDEWLNDDYSLLWAEWFSTPGNSRKLCPVWDTNIKEVKKVLPSVPIDQLLPSEPYFSFAFQCFQYFIEQSDKPSGDTGESQGTINISNSGAVFTGNPNITGKYISSRDMTININSDDND